MTCFIAFSGAKSWNPEYQDPPDRSSSNSSRTVLHRTQSGHNSRERTTSSSLIIGDKRQKNSTTLSESKHRKFLQNKRAKATSQLASFS